MLRNARTILAVMLALFAFVTIRPAQAQSARSATGNAQAMQQLQQLAAERTRLTAENAKLAADLDSMRKERDALKKKQDANDRRLQGTDAVVARAGAKADSLKAELDREKGRLAELVGKYREMAGMLREVETERNTTKTSLGVREGELRQCVDRNVALYTLNGEILSKLEHRGNFTPASALEPFTKLKRVELENLIDGYQTRAEEHRPPAAAMEAPIR